MKNFLKKILVFLGIVAAISASLSITTPTPTFAASTFHCDNFLGMPSWDCGVKDIKAGDDGAQDQLTANIAKIASNILTDISVIASYLIIGYVMYGGYLYMFSSGDPGKVAAAKKTLTNAFIGLAIAMSAFVIFNAIRIALVGTGGNLADCNPTTGSQCVDGGTMVTNLIQWVVGIAGVVAVIFVVIGGWGYITSAGDPGKLQKAKTTILYALIGLVVVALTEIITGFVASLIRDANAGKDTAYIETQIIIDNNKELT